MKIRTVLTLSLLPLGASAQSLKQPHEAAPLNNWAAPMFWQPSQTERALLVRTGAPTSSSANALMFVAISPCRVVDTRAIFNFPAPFGAPSLVANTARSFPMQASTLCSIPSNAAAYSLNITVTPIGTTSLGFLTVWPVGAVQPNASTLNNPDALPALANAAIVPAGNDSSGSIDAFASSATDLIIDINGYYISPTDANQNLTLGGGALIAVSSGSNNTAVGGLSLAANTSGSFNTATGYDTLSANTTGANNTAIGVASLGSTTIGTSNTVVGFGGLFANTTGINNTAIGTDALKNNTAGSNNIGIGFDAAMNVSPSSSNNIHISNSGASGDSGVIKIGTPGTQGAVFVGGVRGISTGLGGAVPVLIDTNGQMGTASSSARFKEDIHDMGDASSALMRLRPVTFRYKQPYTDGSKPLDYGLIAEEVENVYPDLVVKDAKGQIQTVQYQKLTPMLLNELQKMERRVSNLEVLIDGAADK